MMTPETATDATASRPRWPWALLLLALAWSAAIRVPLVVNAAAHLDSDLAVDGLTLIDAVRGHWRWHYPGTPHVGIVPVLLSWPQAMIWGAGPSALVSGGTAAYLALVVATFALAWGAFGPRVAAWGLVPLAFCSTGTVWLSGRVTGGHMLSAAWHAGAFALLAACVSRGGPRRAAALGLWCGLGMYVDSMFAVTLAGLVPAAALSWWWLGRPRSGLVAALAFAPAFVLGIAPREVGARLDPHDAYREQFEPVTSPMVLVEHARLLVFECAPRLIVGHRLPGLQADPDPAALGGPAPLNVPGRERRGAFATVIGLSLWAASAVGLGRAVVPGAGRAIPARAVAAGLIASSAVLLAAFMTNRNIFNADNYRYLVTLLVPWSVGFGLVFDDRARQGKGGLVASAVGALLLAGFMTHDLGRWYDRFGWIDGRGLPVRAVADDPALAWLDAHPEVTDFTGDYWDVYRLAFLTGGRVRGLPYPEFPDRFPEWRRGLPGGHPSVLLYRRSPLGFAYRERVRQARGRVLGQAGRLVFFSWP